MCDTDGIREKRGVVGLRSDIVEGEIYKESINTRPWAAHGAPGADRDEADAVWVSQIRQLYVRFFAKKLRVQVELNSFECTVVAASVQ